ncbi:MAG: hypothetical protein IPN77_16970 [Sandaracinaceae bacterium]|nr:hypothetical protein [Sandaracinaceae bacterium]
MALAATIATKNPDAIRAGKRLLNHSLDIPVDARLRFETELQLQLLGSKNQMEAVMACKDHAGSVSGLGDPRDQTRSLDAYLDQFKARRPR